MEKHWGGIIIILRKPFSDLCITILAQASPNPTSRPGANATPSDTRKVPPTLPFTPSPTPHPRPPAPITAEIPTNRAILSIPAKAMEPPPRSRCWESREGRTRSRWSCAKTSWKRGTVPTKIVAGLPTALRSCERGTPGAPASSTAHVAARSSTRSTSASSASAAILCTTGGRWATSSLDTRGQSGKPCGSTSARSSWRATRFG